MSETRDHLDSLPLAELRRLLALRDSLDKVTKLMEPCIIMVMGVTIGALMLSIYMPMFEMAGAVN